MTPPFYKSCAASEEVTALLGAPPRIYLWGEHDGKPQYPYVTYTTAGQPGNYLAGSPDTTQHSIDIDVWAKSGQSADEVVRALRAAVEPHCYVQSVIHLGRDPDTKSFRVRLQVDWTTA